MEQCWLVLGRALRQLREKESGWKGEEMLEKKVGRLTLKGKRVKCAFVRVYGHGLLLCFTGCRSCESWVMKIPLSLTHGTLELPILL